LAFKIGLLKGGFPAGYAIKVAIRATTKLVAIYVDVSASADLCWFVSVFQENGHWEALQHEPVHGVWDAVEP
jgi:hypothetical protein